MSVDYAAGLSDYDDLGICGLEEVHDKLEHVDLKVETLTNLLRQYRGSCVVHVGAGLSTAAGIPDFRGKRGVWTKKLQDDANVGDSCQSVKQESSSKVDDEKEIEFKPFDETVPTFGHLALVELCRQGYINHIISQNVDGLFLKTGIAKDFISELHGNFYLDECTKCRSRFIRSTASRSMRLQRSSNRCPRFNQKLKPCIGYLRDTILDWESPIPYNELRLAQREAKHSKLHICIGTSMQLRPSKDLVCNPIKSKAHKLVVINLQPTQLDEKANLVINYFADDVLRKLTDKMCIDVPSYNADSDPTRQADKISTPWKRTKL